MRARVLLAFLTVAGFALPPAGAQTAPPRVVTTSGPVTGAVADGVEVFKGIPYAAPPVDDLRWTPPAPPKPWAADLAASDFGPACMQPEPPHNVMPGTPSATMSEDCLTLNVWAPGATDGKAPVIVWLHGGGNVTGSSADHYYDGGHFARDGVVLVSLNYRLGVFGFFAHPALKEKNANFGLLDQIAALKWVKANIAKFGGDPGNVTLMGESAGGEDTLALMTAPAARGLFQKAIAESAGGGWWGPTPLAEAQKQAEEVSKVAGLGDKTDAMALRALDAATLIKSTHGGPDLVLDDALLSTPPLKVFASGKSAGIPLIIGTNSGEGSLIDPDAKPTDIFPMLSPADIDKLRTIYGVDGTALARLIFRDGYFAGPAHYVAVQQEKSGHPVFQYRFNYVLAFLQGRRPDATHGSEIPFVFGNLPGHFPSREDRAVSAALHQCWVAFAKTGKPDCTAAPGWTSGSDRWMVFDTTASEQPLGSTEAMDLLQSRQTVGPQ